VTNENFFNEDGPTSDWNRENEKIEMELLLEAIYRK